MERNILHIIDTRGPGGAETVFIALAEESLNRNYGCLAVINGSGWIENQLRDRNIPYIICSSKGSFNLSYLIRLLKIVSRNNISVIQSHLLGSNVYAAFIGLFTSVKVFATFHGHVDIGKKEKLKKIKLAIIKFGAKRLVCVSPNLAEEIRTICGRGARIDPLVIPNGINTAGLINLPARERKHDSQSIIFGSLGNIRKAKNYGLAIEFINKLNEEGFSANLLIAGDDSKPEANELKKKVKNLGLEAKIKFLGFQSDVPSFMESFDVFLLTSSSEGHPLAVLQALAAGKPILSTRNGIENIIPEELLFLSEVHEPVSLAKAFQGLMSNDSIEDVVTKGRVLVQEVYSQSAMLENYFELYQKSK